MDYCGGSKWMISRILGKALGKHPDVIYGYTRIVRQLDWTDRGGEELEERAGKEEWRMHRP